MSGAEAVHWGWTAVMAVVLIALLLMGDGGERG